MDPISAIPCDGGDTMTEEGQLVATHVHRIPDTVPDEKVYQFYQKTKSRAAEYLVTATLNSDDRTITFSELDDRWSPGPALNTHGKRELSTFTVSFPEKRATKLKDAWPVMETTFYEYGIACNLNLDERTMQVSTTKALKHYSVFDSARRLLELLSTGPVPPYMALEMVQGRKHEVIEIGDQQGGLCTRYGIKKEEYHKRWETLFYSLKALSKAMQCHIFLNENTFTAVTAVESTDEQIFWDKRIYCLKIVLIDCITKGLCPLTSIGKFKEKFRKYQSMDDLKDLHAKHMELVKAGPSLIKDGLPEVCSLYALLNERRATRLLEASWMLERSLGGYGISCTLEKDCVTFATIGCTTKPDVIDKAWQLLELLSTTHVPASLALEIMDGSKNACLIKIGSQEGGMCPSYGISEEEYRIRWECLRQSLQAVAEIAVCNVFLNYDTVAAVGSTSLELMKRFVVNCILYNVCPGTAFMDINHVSRGLDNIEDPHVKHVEMDIENSELSVRMLEVSSFCTFVSEEQVDQLKYNWLAVELCLRKHGISCKLVADDYYMAVSVTTKAGESNISDKISNILKFLSVDAPPMKAMEALESSMHCDHIPTGSRYGGYCLKYGITEEDFDKVVWPKAKRGLKEIGEALKCCVLLSPDVIFVYGPSSEDTDILQDFVRHCFERTRLPPFRRKLPLPKS